MDGSLRGLSLWLKAREVRLVLAYAAGVIAFQWLRSGSVSWADVVTSCAVAVGGLAVSKGLGDEPLLTLPDREVRQRLVGLFRGETPDVDTVYATPRHASNQFSDLRQATDRYFVGTMNPDAYRSWAMAELASQEVSKPS